MDKTFGYFIFGGLLIGALFGSMWTAGKSTLMGSGASALAGVFLGWFIAAVVLEQTKKKQDK